MSVEVMIYAYLFVCLAMIIFNIVTAIILKQKDKKTVKISENFSNRVKLQLERVKVGEPCDENHKQYMQKRLKKVGNMVAFDKMLEAAYLDDPETVKKYLYELDSVFIFLCGVYNGKDRIEAAYFPYIVKKYRLIAFRKLPTVTETMLSLLDEPSIYCRENAMQALYTCGDSDCIIKALKKIDKSNLYYNGKLITDGMLNFAGSTEELINKIIARFNTFSIDMKIALLNYIRFSSPKHCEFAYSLLCDENQKESIISALSDISQSKKSGWLINSAKNDFFVKKRNFYAIVSAAILLFAAIIISVIVILAKKRRQKSKINKMIDQNTGVGNAEYYIYAFENLISEQAKNLYNLAYISFDIDRYNNGSVSAPDIEKYAAVKLSQLVNSCEYLSRISDGVFIMMFQAENSNIADKRVADLVFSVNKYVADFTNESDIFKAGYCAFCENIGIDAETAVYNAKQGYLYAVSNALPYYMGTKSQIEKNKKAKILASQIDNALKNGEFKAHIQFFTESKTSNFCGGEILSRWQNSTYGLLRPNEYIDILNKTGKIVEHDYKIFEEVCAILEKWNTPPFDKMFLSCNFTRNSVSDPEFVNKLISISEKYNFAKNRLAVEITENTLSINSTTVSENIKRLRKYGFLVAIDDMGAGFSSLADIYDNEVDIVKIECSFVSSCITDRRREMLSNIISLIHNAGAKVVCEGAETQQQVDMLKSIDCDIIQGFYYSRVLPLTEGEKFILTK